MSRKSNPSSKEERLKQARDGLRKEFPLGNEVLTIHGQAVPASSLVGRADQYLGLYGAVEDTRKALTAKVEARDAADPEIDQFLEDVQSGVTSAFAPTDQRLASFGFPVKHKPRELTTQENAIKAAKAKLTRQLRHTMGKRQKKDIKAGSVQPTSNTSNGAQPNPPAAGGEATK